MTVVMGVMRKGVGGTPARTTNFSAATVWNAHKGENYGFIETFKASVSHATGPATLTTTAETGETRRAVREVSASRRLNSSATMDNASTSKVSIFSLSRRRWYIWGVPNAPFAHDSYITQ